MYWRSCALVLLVVACAVVSGEEATSKSASPDLSEPEVWGQLKDGGHPWLLEFYAPWCGYCKKLAPIWETVAEKLNSAAEGSPSKIRVAKIDCNSANNKGVCKKYRVKGFPTIKVVDKGYVYDFPQKERNEENILSFAQDFAKEVANPAWLPGPPTPFDEYIEWAENVILDIAILWNELRPATMITGGGAFLVGVFFTMLWLPLVLRPPAPKKDSAPAKK